jgi:hypothetical protein
METEILSHLWQLAIALIVAGVGINYEDSQG